MTEQVLVVPAAVLEEAGTFVGFTREVERYRPRLLDPARLLYVPRVRAEHDPSFKQLIPYVVLRWGEQVFHYRRGASGTEKRLEALRSIGIGGHISEADAVGGDDPYQTGMLRELTEEVDVGCGFRERCIGFINDDRTPVGSVHLGVVHIFELESPSAHSREDALADGGFANWNELFKESGQFETWSQFVLESLHDQSLRR